MPTAWKHYGREFQGAVRRYRRENVGRAVFGDIDFDRNRQWAMRACADCGVEALEPLWKESRARLMEEFLSTGSRARVVPSGTEFLAETPFEVV